MLAQLNPRSFISGVKTNLSAVLKEYNRNEFHHVYPRQLLKHSNQDAFDDTCFANICFLSRSDNNTISGAAPSAYRAKLPQGITEILESNLLPASTFSDDFTVFANERADLLSAYASKLVS